LLVDYPLLPKNGQRKCLIGSAHGHAQTESKEAVVMPDDVIKRGETSIMEKAALRVCPNPPAIR